MVKTQITETIRFINDVWTDEIQAFMNTKAVVETQLEEQNYLRFNESFDYLTDLSICSFSQESMDNLKSLISEEEFNNIWET